MGKLFGASRKGSKAEREVKQNYKIGRELGKGRFAVVKVCKNKKTKEEFALKIVDKTKMSMQDIESLKREIKILSNLDHEGIIKVIEVYNDEHATYIVNELVRGGELFDRIKVKDAYNEKSAATLVRKIVVALKYCHDQGVVHRDLKPENLLLVSPTDDTSVKIADFGFADYVPPEGLDDGCGTLVYVAPEILEGKRYKTEVDMWSLGVITYILLCGYPPIFSNDEKKMIRLVRRGNYGFDKEYWSGISHDAKDFVSNLLTLDQEQRMTADDVLNHPWITGRAELPTQELKGAQQRLAQFQTEQKLRNALGALKVINILKHLGDDDEFNEAMNNDL